MEEDGMIKMAKGQAGNYAIFIELYNQTVFDIILLSSLDDSIFHATLKNQTMPQSCQKLYKNVEQLYEHIETNINDQKIISVSDIGGILITDFAEMKGKKIKVECSINCEKIIELEQINKFYLKIIRFLQSKEKQRVNIFLQKYNEKSQIKGVSILSKEQRSQINKNYQFKQINLSVDMLNNPYLNFFNKFRDQIKIQEQSKSRIKLYFHQAIPKQGCYFMSIKTVNLKSNAFSIGIIDKNQDRNLHRSPYSFAFQFRSGQIKDTNYIKQKKQTGWRSGCTKTADLRGAILRMEINMDEKRLFYYCNGKKVGQTIISDYLMGKQLIGYVSCKHLGDEFILNQN